MNIALSSNRFAALPVFLVAGLVFSTLAAKAQILITPTDDFASSYYSAAQTPTNLINNSGLDTSSGNVLTYTAAADSSANGMWHAGAGQGIGGNAPVVADQYVVFDLGANYDLTSAYLWQMMETNLLGRGIDQFQLYASSSAPSSSDESNPPSTYNLSGFTEILGPSTLQEAAAGATSTATQAFSLTDATDVRQVVLQIDSDWNGLTNDYVGLSEIKFAGTELAANTAAWANPSGGSWQTAGNWSTGTVPGGNDTANFAVGGTYTVNSTANVSVGTVNVSTGTVTLDLATNTLNASTVNVSGTSPSLSITDGGQVSAQNVSIGMNGGTGSVFVQGTGSSLSGTGTYFFLGTGTLSLSNGGQASGNDTYIGYGATGHATVSGSGSELSGSTDLEVGISGGTGSLALSGGGKAVGGDEVIIGDADSTGTVTVDGSGSSLTTGTTGTPQIDVGYAVDTSPGNGTLIVTNGGQVSTSDFLEIGAFGGQGAVVVGKSDGTDTGGTQLSAGAINVTDGNSAGGSLTIYAGGTVTATQGGQVYINAVNSGETAQINLDGGVLATEQVTNTNGIASAQLNFNGGTLRATANDSDFISNFSAGQVTLQGGGGTIDNGGNFVTVNAVIGGSGALTSTGSDELVLASANTYGGGTVINNGTLLVGSLAAVGTAQPLGKGSTLTFTSTSVSNSDGLLQYSGGTATLRQSVAVSTGDIGLIANTGGGVLTLSGGISTNGGAFTVSAGKFVVSSAITGTASNSNFILGNTARAGAATVGLTAISSYNGSTSITDGSTLLTGVNGVLPTSTPSAVVFGSSSDGSNKTNTLDLLGTSQTVASLTSVKGTNRVISSNGSATTPGSGTAASAATGTLTVDYTNTSTADVFSGSLGGATGSATKFALVKTGAGTLTLSSANTYTGGTQVNGGTLLATGGVANSSSATGTGAISVASGAILGGTGVVRPTVAKAGITLARGSTLLSGTPASGTTIPTGLTLDNTSAKGTILDASLGNATLSFILGSGTQSLSGGTGGTYANPYTASSYLKIDDDKASDAAGELKFTLGDIIAITDVSTTPLLNGEYLLIHAGSDSDYAGLVTSGGQAGGFALNGVVENLTLSGISGQLYLDNGNLEVEEVPEPSTSALVAVALGCLAVAVNLRAKRSRRLVPRV